MSDSALRSWVGRLWAPAPLRLLLFGALSALAMPPVDAWWVLFIVVPLALATFVKAKQQPLWWATLLGWCFGLGYFIASLHWIGFAFLVDAAHDLWMMPFALGGLAAFLALFWAVATLAGMLLTRCGYPAWISFPVAFAALEWLRGHLFTGFPWAVFGQAFDGLLNVEQLASVIGMTGLTLMAWTWASALFGILTGEGRHRQVAAALLLTFPLAWGWGAWRLAHNPTRYVDGVTVRLVQPNISQNDKWRQGNARKIFDQLLALTARPSSSGQPVTHVIWPESSIPFLIDESAQGRAELAKALQPGQTLLAGAVRRSAPDDAAQYFTSILMFNDKAEITGHYDKWRLVPGGEFLPMAWALEPLGLRKVVSLPESFTPGTGPATLEVPGIGPASPSVCYEAIFPESASGTIIRPNWLLNVTNDGWFGNSAGPWQHLAQMRLRSIETGLPAARAANTGISAIIDPLGRISFQSQIGQSDTFDLLLPQNIDATLYGIGQDYLMLLLLLVAISVGQLLKIR